MAETTLITISDVQEFRKIDPKFNSDKFNAYVKEVQRKGLRNLLGDALYYAFMNSDRLTGTYETLLNGTTYTYSNQTIEFYGIKPFIIYHWLSIATREGDLFLTTHGAVNFTNNPQQHFEQSKEKQRIAAEYIDTANMYANDTIQFLNEHTSDYSLWKSEIETSNAEFISFKI